MKRNEPYGRVSTIERTSEGEVLNIVVSPDDINGNVFVGRDEILESYEEISIGDRVYACSHNKLTIDPYCHSCGNEKFPLDNGSLHCPICE